MQRLSSGLALILREVPPWALPCFVVLYCGTAVRQLGKNTMKRPRSLVLTTALVVAASLGLGWCQRAQAQAPAKVLLEQQNINVGDQEAMFHGCAEQINQVMVQTTLNFNLFLVGFPTNPLDPSMLFQDLNLDKLLQPAVPPPGPPPPSGGGTPKVTNQTIVETDIN